MKLRELIDNGTITPEEAVVGYIASFPTAETISGYTAFLLGIRSEAPEAVMRVRYVNSLSNFSREKKNARALIDEGCIIISQNSGTTGPAAACQEASANRLVYFVGYNDNLIDVASTISLVSSRPNWDNYVLNAVQAVIADRPIEKQAAGDVHGNDICAGFDHGWVEVIDLNEDITAPGTDEKIQKAIEEIRQGKLKIFIGDYVGVDANNSRIKIDLNEGFKENSSSSQATFHYILRDVITIEETIE